MTVAAPCKPPRPGITGVFSLSPPGSRPRRNNGHPKKKHIDFTLLCSLVTVGYCNWYGKVPSVVCCLYRSSALRRAQRRSGAAPARRHGQRQRTPTTPGVGDHARDADARDGRRRRGAEGHSPRTNDCRGPGARRLGNSVTSAAPARRGSSRSVL